MDKNTEKYIHSLEHSLTMIENILSGKQQNYTDFSDDILSAHKEQLQKEIQNLKFK
jgi:hypothetical protein